MDLKKNRKSYLNKFPEYISEKATEFVVKIKNKFIIKIIYMSVKKSTVYYFI